MISRPVALRDTYLGIDVSFAKKKPLPVAALVKANGRLEMLPLRQTFDRPPLGRGNVLALDADERRGFAIEVLAWIQKLEREQGLKIRCIALDAPSDYCCHFSGRRAAETALDAEGISCFATPTKTQFDEKVAAAQRHLDAGGKPARLPAANQFWMLVGFALFRTLRQHHYECIETYPQAIVRALKCRLGHKSTAEGYESQLEAAGRLFGLGPRLLEAEIATMGFGSRHDRLDALLTAWVASLGSAGRRALGTPPRDVIWIPSDSAAAANNGQVQKV